MCPSSIVPSRSKWQHKRGYKEPSYDRKLLLAACEPIIPRDLRPSWDRCGRPAFEAMLKEKKMTRNPREDLLAGILKRDMLEGTLVAFFHVNSVLLEDYTAIKNSLQHKNLWMKKFNRNIYESAIRDTKFASMRSVLCDQPNTVMVIGKGDEDLKTLIRMEKKMPGFLLMCAFVEDRILRKDEMITYSQIGSLADVRAQLSATLNHALASLPSHITHPATLLSLTLDQYVKREQDTGKKKKKDGSDQERGKDQAEGGKVQ